MAVQGFTTLRELARRDLSAALMSNDVGRSTHMTAMTVFDGER